MPDRPSNQRAKQDTALRELLRGRPAGGPLVTLSWTCCDYCGDRLDVRPSDSGLWLCAACRRQEENR